MRDGVKDGKKTIMCVQEEKARKSGTKAGKREENYDAYLYTTEVVEVKKSERKYIYK